MHSKCLGYWAYLIDNRYLGNALGIEPILDNMCIVNAFGIGPTSLCLVEQVHKRS